MKINKYITYSLNKEKNNCFFFDLEIWINESMKEMNQWINQNTSESWSLLQMIVLGYLGRSDSRSSRNIVIANVSALGLEISVYFSLSFFNITKTNNNKHNTLRRCKNIISLVYSSYKNVNWLEECTFWKIMKVFFTFGCEECHWMFIFFGGNKTFGKFE
jgi:hypothetical protein